MKTYEKCFMLAFPTDRTILKSSQYIFEPKLDGTRVHIIKKGKSVKLINRRGKDISYRYPELQHVWKNIKAKTAILDAELVVLNQQQKPDFNLLQQREQQDKKINIALLAKQIPAVLFVFDVLMLNDKITASKTLLERKSILDSVIKQDKNIVVCPYTFDGIKLWKAVKKLKLEGVMAKRIDSVYECCRSKSWLKIKNIKTIDAIVIGYTIKQRQNASKSKRCISALLLALYEKPKTKKQEKIKQRKLVYIGRVGTGFSAEQLETIKAILDKHKSKQMPALKNKQMLNKIKSNTVIVWLKPEVIAEIKYLEFTKQKELRASSFVRLRFDKPPEECVME